MAVRARHAFRFPGVHAADDAPGRERPLGEDHVPRRQAVSEGMQTDAYRYRRETETGVQGLVVPDFPVFMPAVSV